jgi:hypothetical protein
MNDSIIFMLLLVISDRFGMQPCDERTSVADTWQSIAIPLFEISDNFKVRKLFFLDF